MAQGDYEQGLDKLRSGDRVGALHAFNQVLQDNPDRIEAYLKRASVQLGLGDIQSAIADYTQALSRDPSAEAFLGRALAHLAGSSLSAALQDGEQAIALNPRLAAAHQLLGKIYRQLDQLPAAIRAYKQATQIYIDQQDKLSAERCLAALEALQSPPTRQPIVSTPPTPISHQAHSQAPLIQPGEFLRVILEKIRQGNYTAALADLNWMIQLDPRDARAYCQRGIVNAKLGNAQAAIQDLSKAMELAPQDANILRQRSLVRLELGDARGAIADLNQLLRDTPDNLHLYLYRGNAYRRLEDYRQAIEDYSRAIYFAPKDADLYEHRAEARRAFEDFSGAIEDYHQASSLWLDQGQGQRYQAAINQIPALEAALKQKRSRSSSNTLPRELELDHLRQRLIRLVGGSWEMAERLVEIARFKYPGESEEWYLQKVIFDLESNR